MRPRHLPGSRSPPSLVTVSREHRDPQVGIVSPADQLVPGQPRGGELDARDVVAQAKDRYGDVLRSLDQRLCAQQRGQLMIRGHTRSSAEDPASDDRLLFRHGRRLATSSCGS